MEQMIADGYYHYQTRSPFLSISILISLFSHIAFITSPSSLVSSPKPCLRPFLKLPSQKSVPIMEVPLPSALSLRHSPSQQSPSYQVQMPWPCFFPLQKLPSYLSPFQYYMTPNPWYLPSRKEPRQTQFPFSTQTPSPLNQLFSQLPSYLSPFLQTISPFPYFTPPFHSPRQVAWLVSSTPSPLRQPSRKSPLYIDLRMSGFSPLLGFFLRFITISTPLPLLKSSLNQPMQITFLELRSSPLPWYLPLKKEPLYTQPSLFALQTNWPCPCGCQFSTSPLQSVPRVSEQMFIYFSVPSQKYSFSCFIIPLLSKRSQLQQTMMLGIVSNTSRTMLAGKEVLTSYKCSRYFQLRQGLFFQLRMIWQSSSSWGFQRRKTFFWPSRKSFIWSLKRVIVSESLSYSSLLSCGMPSSSPSACSNSCQPASTSLTQIFESSSIQTDYIILMNFEENFTCPVCLELARSAVESSCCTKIFCEKCIQDIHKKFGHCPCCRSTNISWHQSKIARRVISEIKVPCEYCEAKVENGALEAHLAKCPKVPIMCRICKEKMVQEIIPKHTATVHQKEAKDYLIAHVLGIKTKVESKIQSTTDPAINYFRTQKNRDGLKAAMGDTSKYYCGGRMMGKCNCCNGQCGPDNGENCDACMQLDVKRWNLQRGCLINTAGYVCQVLYVQNVKRVSCYRVIVRKQGNIFNPQPKLTECRPGHCCQSCTQMEYSLNIGRYKGLY